MTEFVWRHIGPNESEIGQMLERVGIASLQDFVSSALPSSIRLSGEFEVEGCSEPSTERDVLSRAFELAEKNHCFRSLIGCGYADCIVPPVIQRNILENPGWYTQYTPYQPEISQGRLEALLNFQTLITELTGLHIANASMLDEATAAAEAMALCLSAAGGKEKRRFLISDAVHPQTLAVIETRAIGLSVEVVQFSEGRDLASGSATQGDFQSLLGKEVFGVLFQYPNSFGAVRDYSALVSQAKSVGAKVVFASDPLALVLLKTPGEQGADIAVGSVQRFGVPLGFGGPHAGFLATHESFTRKLPGRLVGISRDAQGNPALRLTLQTREQHIRREKATSNICTAQVLLAVMSSMYAVYHGSEGLRRIALRVASHAAKLSAALETLGFSQLNKQFFDTLLISGVDQNELRLEAERRMINLRYFAGSSDFPGCNAVGLTLDECTDDAEIEQLVELFGTISRKKTTATPQSAASTIAIDDSLLRSGEQFLQQRIFNSYHSETEMLRYMRRLEGKDLSLTHSMIPLGSCTMKLNATAEMIPIGYRGFSSLHPFAPLSQAAGYLELFSELESALRDITGFHAVSLQPNAGSQGEYAGLLAIRQYLDSIGASQRSICLIPTSAHGTNPASAVMNGFRVVPVACDAQGNIDFKDLTHKVEQHCAELAVLMVTYPSTHGVFEENICEVCELIHAAGGQVYLDGANLNALVGLAKPADFGADVCHINLHKTFCIPHGGGGPGMGPIAVAEHLTPFLPGHPITAPGNDRQGGAVSAAPWGSASILPISWAYMKLMGASGMKLATEVAILSANYIAKRLEGHFEVLYRGRNGMVAHECIIDTRPFKKTAGIEVDDIAKRLIDYGFHAPTMSWPVAGTLMIEPTESESLAELDRFCDAMIAIREEIKKVEAGAWSQSDNPLKHAPHTVEAVTATEWPHSYSREEAAFPAPWSRQLKFWPAAARVDSAFGDRNLVCSCESVEELARGG